MAVPTHGAILLDDTLEYVLLVQGYWARASWGFPKGKVNEGEEPHACAVREVLEETGYDISSMLRREDFIELKVLDQLVRLYLIVGVPRDTKFQARTRREIKSIEWFAIADLPSHKRDQAPKATLGLSPNAFFMVMPFVKPLRKWIFNSKQRRAQQGRAKERSITDNEKLKQKQQQYFASLYQNELADFLRVAERQNDRSPSPPMTMPPPRFQIAQRRDVKTQECSTARRTLNSELGCRAGFRKNIIPMFSSPTWTKFALDRKALMACLQG
ncbi:m7GpppN-mRNA hydrolase-like [Ornithodoros turicata]|uniref:m7GpppN-mRNA hydrolase-like n=1 Tax=Ornithodoros turicata TaxID=34597 RepID=UPI0031396C51